MVPAFSLKLSLAGEDPAGHHRSAAPARSGSNAVLFSTTPSSLQPWGALRVKHVSSDPAHVPLGLSRRTSRTLAGYAAMMAATVVAFLLIRHFGEALRAPTPSLSSTSRPRLT